MTNDRWANPTATQLNGTEGFFGNNTGVVPAENDDCGEPIRNDGIQEPMACDEVKMRRNDPSPMPDDPTKLMTLRDLVTHLASLKQDAFAVNMLQIGDWNRKNREKLLGRQL